MLLTVAPQVTSHVWELHSNRDRKPALGSSVEKFRGRVEACLAASVAFCIAGGCRPWSQGGPALRRAHISPPGIHSAAAARA
jgi:hypothetical protein